jgi:23S rRNA (cytosine1962-C5)-methyltransferase
MARLKIKLARNLRRSLLQGHPWVYREAIAAPVEPVERAQLCQVLDGKNELGWAIYDPHGALALRMLSTDSAPPTGSILSRRFARAWSLRKNLQAHFDTDAFRLFNGEGDLVPGMICDIYGTLAVLQRIGLSKAISDPNRMYRQVNIETISPWPGWIFNGFS